MIRFLQELLMQRATKCATSHTSLKDRCPVLRLLTQKISCEEQCVLYLYLFPGAWVWNPVEHFECVLSGTSEPFALLVVVFLYRHKTSHIRKGG